MNKITCEHYPVEKLPDDLRKQFAGFETVTLVGERGAAVPNAGPMDPNDHFDALMDSIRPMTLAELVADRAAHPENYRGAVSAEDAVARVRAIRDEWDSNR